MLLHETKKCFISWTSFQNMKKFFRIKNNPNYKKVHSYKKKIEFFNWCQVTHEIKKLNFFLFHALVAKNIKKLF